MASDCCAGLLPIPCCARQHDSAAHLSTTCQPAVAECPHPAQSASTGAVGATNPTVEPMGSTTSRPASLSRRTATYLTHAPQPAINLQESRKASKSQFSS